MTPFVFIWPYAVVFWIVFLWTFMPEWQIIRKARERVKSKESNDDRSLRVIAFGMQFTSMVAFVLPFILGSTMEIGNQQIAFWSGTGLLFCGSLLRRHCWRMLGEYFTGEVSARRDQPVISTGAYRWVRHPSYTAGIIMMAGIGVALGNWAAVFLLTVMSFAVYTYRVRVEERVLAETLGPAYVSYMQGRKRFIPFVV